MPKKPGLTPPRPFMATTMSPPRHLYNLAIHCGGVDGMKKDAMINAALKLFIKDVKERHPDAFNEEIE